jgi:hypothetical protein
MNEKHEPLQIYAGSVRMSDILGLVEASDIVFIDSSEVIINPEDDKIKKLFNDVATTMLPINSLIRIDEVAFKKDTPVIRLYQSNEKNNESNTP